MYWEKNIESDLNYVSKIHEIANVIKNLNIDENYLFTGKLGVSLFSFYYGRQFKNEDFIDLGYDYIEEVISTINIQNREFSLCNGICGFYWLIKHLEKEKFIETGAFQDSEILEEYLLARLDKEIKLNNWDYLHGSLGIIWTLLNYRHYLIRERSFYLLEQLEKSCDLFSNGRMALRSRLIDSNNRPYDVYNLGLAHGLPGVLLILSTFIKKGIQPDYSKDILQKIYKYLESQKLNYKITGNFFKNWLLVNEGIESKQSRLAWCYGDLGIGYALYEVGVNIADDDLKKNAIEILLNSTKKKTIEESAVVDAGLCHGSVGIAHIYNRLFRKTNIYEFKKMSLFWYQKTLELARFKDGYAGYKANDRRKWVSEYNLLVGISGIGLSLMSATSHYEPKWDNCFMLS